MTMAQPRARKLCEDDADFYPVSDGKPMAETALHRAEMTYAIEALSLFLADRPDVWVSGNDFFYWERGNPKAVVSPDCYVVFGVPRRRHDCYKAWEENGKLPDVVLECTSKKTRHEDTRRKRPLYEQTLNVPEYFQFDPTADYLKPPLQGFRLRDGVYVRIETDDDRLHSEQLNLDLTIEEGHLRFLNAVTGEKLLTYREHALRQEEEAFRAEQQTRIAAEERLRADEERRKNQEAEAEIAQLRAELEALRNGKTE